MRTFKQILSEKQQIGQFSQAANQVAARLRIMWAKIKQGPQNQKQYEAQAQELINDLAEAFPDVDLSAAVQASQAGNLPLTISSLVRANAPGP